MVCCWAQELLGYHLTIVQRSNKMMVDVDALTWLFGHLISHHIAIASLRSIRNRANCPHAYAATKLSKLGNVKITETDNPFSNPPTFLTHNVLHHFYHYGTNHSTTSSCLEISSSPYITTLPIKMQPYPKFCAISPLQKSVTPNTANVSQSKMSPSISFSGI